MTLTQRLDQARQRLTEALKAGDDTSAHRAAIAQIEGDLQRQTDAATATRADDDRIRQETIHARAAAIAAEARRLISSEIAKLDTEDA